MKMRTQKTFTFLLLLSFLFAYHVSVSAISYEPITSFFKKIPSFPKKVSIDYEKMTEYLKKAQEPIDPKNFKDYVDIIETLENDGYLNTSFLKSYIPDKSEISLQSAITKIQENYNLPVTGKPDQTTINYILMPRCDVPDIINGTNTVTKFVNQSTSFKPWWNNDKKNLTYAFLPKNEVPDTIKSLFQDAFNRWSNVTKLNFTETMLFNRSDIRIGFFSPDAKGRVVGGTYIRNNTGRVLIYLTKEILVNLESVVMHQIGHLLGLGHSPVEEAIMYPIMLPKKKIELVNDDLQKIQQIYGVNKSSSNLVESSANHQHSAALNIVLVLGLTSGLLVIRLLDVCMFYC
ncbi:unnamed protein product [Trifolium pratense]|uniref:Uncharacterized protein n=1 Tax=Trifolium pratense TaxID=57577 RepID=A0ACB0JU17_TRIPR|nr:unnamed protein product [Trifolium pratense]